MTAIVQKGTKSTPGTSSARNAGRNSQCHPSRFTSTAATAISSTSSAGDKAPSANNGNTKIWSASAAMARIIAARKRERGESEIGSSVMTGAAFILPILTESNTSCYHCTYQSECGDQRDQHPTRARVLERRAGFIFGAALADRSSLAYFCTEHVSSPSSVARSTVVQLTSTPSRK